MYLDKSTPHVTYRWAGWAALLLVYALRVVSIEGFYIVTYALGIYNLNLLLGFLTPLHVDADAEGPTLPSKSDEEFRPFVRRLPEFKFWCAAPQAADQPTGRKISPPRSQPCTWQGAAPVRRPAHPAPLTCSSSLPAPAPAAAAAAAGTPARAPSAWASPPPSSRCSTSPCSGPSCCSTGWSSSSSP
jgi:hypothetical protein